MTSSGKKKNPGLLLDHVAYDEPYVSKYKYYLSTNKLDLTKVEKKNQERVVFNQYPIYLQHSLFYQGEDFKKVRRLECCSRFLAYEELREKGNKYFNQGQYGKALEYYERSISLFKWLEYS